MTHRQLGRRAAVVAGGLLWLLGTAAPAAQAAQAHPLGNFSVNHYTGFTVRPDRVDVLAVTDTAEIPTLQAAPRVDTDGDGTPSAAERAAWATARCAETAGKLAVTAPRRLTWKVSSATFAYRSGQSGLRTSRLDCRLRAPLELTDGPQTLRIDTGADRARVGWNEITAKGAGTHLRDSTVPASSSTGELRHYPRDLLATPLGDTTARFTAVPGAAASSGTEGTSRAGAVGGLTGGVEALSQRLTSLTGTRTLTVPVGVLAVLLSVVLGAGHALLPGHGKTVMAAYLAGKRGSTRDALTVGATVTATHTAGVLVVGLCLTTFSALAGDTVLNWLGVVSGALVAAVGAALLLDAVRGARRRRLDAATIGAVPPGAREPALVGAAGAADTAAEIAHGHTHDAGHGHGPQHGLGHGHGPADGHHRNHHHPHEKPHRHGLFGHHHHSHSPSATDADRPYTRRGLIGLGVAGGLVPSPSALVVLLGSIALGRTVFGAGLVLAYGLGMAATLTAVGLILVRLGDRLGTLTDRPLFAFLRRLAPSTALLTAALVLVVGLGLMIRSLPPVL
ncbi:nickel/cobalt transporter [Streptomyces sp. NBC_00370]|uniref:nickel/cobalt transporter n=1 Tax=Streptomyces sp. NBC_00370 TaxID=2975728 RepID=UPI002E253F4E